VQVQGGVAPLSTLTQYEAESFSKSTFKQSLPSGLVEWGILKHNIEAHGSTSISGSSAARRTADSSVSPDKRGRQAASPSFLDRSVAASADVRPMC
jgi:hypothetical protein